MALSAFFAIQPHEAYLGSSSESDPGRYRSVAPFSVLYQPTGEGKLGLCLKHGGLKQRQGFQVAFVCRPSSKQSKELPAFCQYRPG